MPTRLDAIDWKILDELQRNGRITNVELARRVGISAPPCLRRMRALEQAGFIKGYRALLDEKLLGYEITVFAMVHLASQAEPDLLAFEKLDEADTLDVFGGESLVALGTDELERSQAAHALDRLPGSGAQLLSRQLRSRAFFHAAPLAWEHDRRCVKTCQPRSLA